MNDAEILRASKDNQSKASSGINFDLIPDDRRRSFASVIVKGQRLVLSDFLRFSLLSRRGLRDSFHEEKRAN